MFIPSLKPFGRLRVNKNKLNWFGHELTALGGLGNENATLVDLLTRIGCKEAYGDVWKEAVQPMAIVWFLDWMLQLPLLLIPLVT
jgi:hypothetical protein